MEIVELDCTLITVWLSTDLNSIIVTDGINVIDTESAKFVYVHQYQFTYLLNAARTIISTSVPCKQKAATENLLNKWQMFAAGIQHGQRLHNLGIKTSQTTKLFGLRPRLHNVVWIECFNL